MKAPHTRCMFTVGHVDQIGRDSDWPTDAVRLYAVSAGDDGTPEEQRFTKATPSGDLSIRIQNPALIGKFEAGQRVYIDIAPAD